MPIQVHCPQGHRLSVSEKYAGRQVKCPKCHEVLRIPTLPGTTTTAVSRQAAPQQKGGDQARNPPQPPPIPKPPVARPPVARSPQAAPPAVRAVPPPAPVADVAAQPGTGPTTPVPRLRAWTAEGVRGYRPERSQVNTVYLLAVGIVLLVGLQLAPAASNFDLATAPNWVRWLMMLAVLQLAYTIWMVSFPDWSSVQTTMLALAAVTTLYGVALGISTLTPPEQSLPFDLNDVRDKVRLWCGAILLLLGLLTYVCGRVAFRWRKAFQAMAPH